jgi:hypothetical protein
MSSKNDREYSFIELNVTSQLDDTIPDVAPLNVTPLDVMPLLWT